MKLTRSQIYVLMVGILTLVTGLVTNIASNQIPERLKPYLWYSWPLLVLLTVAFLFLTIKNENRSDGLPKVEFNLKHYYDTLLKRYRTLDLDALTPPQREEYLQLQLRAVFVEQSVRENPPPVELPKEILEKLQREGELKLDDLPAEVSMDEIRASGDQYYKNTPTPVIDVLTASQVPHAVILGDPGSGKSTLTRYVILSLVDSSGGDERLRRTFADLLPVLVELRTYNALRGEGKCDTFLEFLEFLGKTDGWNLTQTVLHEKLTTKGGIVIFDGLDEIFEPVDRERVSHAIAGFAQTYPKAGVLVTSRIVGYQRKVLTDAGFAHYTLQDLNRQQVESFVTRWYDLALADRPDDAQHRKQRILDSFDQSSSIRQLAGNPMLLTIMAIIAKNQELPRERWKLYDHAASVLIEHWDVKRHLESINVDAPFIEEEDKKELLRRLAYRMQAGNAGLKGNYIHREQLQQEFNDYLVERFTLPADRAKTISKIMIDQFHRRNFILSLYGASVYGFVHRAFLEYFCATAFTHKFEKEHAVSIDDLAKDVFGTHWHDQSWHEVLRLICGILDEPFAAQLITHLLMIRSAGDQTDLKPANVELALRCLGEVRKINSIVDCTDLALDRVFESFQNLTNNSNTSDRYEFSRALINGIKSLGYKWPNRIRLVDILKRLSVGRWAWCYDHHFGDLVIPLGGDLDPVRDALKAYATREDANIRCLWPRPLIAGWKEDPETLTLLKKQIGSDSDVHCRRNAVEAFLSFYDETPDAVALMRERLEHENDDMIRGQAMAFLGRVGDETSINIVKEYLSNESSLLRSGALRALAPKLDDEAIFLLLLQRLAKEENAWIRRVYYEELAARRGKDQRVRTLLVDAAVNEDDSDCRTVVLELLSNSYSNDTKVMNLIRSRSQADPDPDVRNRANQLLESSASAPVS
jgi:HEAT repeats/NACHT domain